MKIKVKKFKNLKMALEQLKPFVLNGAHLRTGKPFKIFGNLRSREILTNWLLCAAANSVVKNERLTFCDDPQGSDGIILDTQTGEIWVTEHIIVLPPPNRKEETLNELILKAIQNKCNKGGAAYAQGKTLAVLVDVGNDEMWNPNTIARHLPNPLNFEAVWVVGLHGVKDKKYCYNVTRLDLRRGNAPVWRIHLNENFDDWVVENVQ